VYSIIAYRK